MLVLEALLEFLLPSWSEVQVSVAAAALVLTAFWFLTVTAAADDRTLVDTSASVANVNDDRELREEVSFVNFTSKLAFSLIFMFLYFCFRLFVLVP